MRNGQSGQKRWSRILALILFVLAVLAVGAECKAEAVSSATVKKLFADPQRQYSTGPLWVWNDRMTERRIRESLREFAGQKVRQAFVHPRPGLMTPYLSDEWFRMWKVSLDEAEKLDMNILIYDENSYPSGFAGGLVPAAMPESRGKGLVIREEKTAPAWSDDIVAVHRFFGFGYENVTSRVQAGEKMPEARYLVASIETRPKSAWFGGWWYVDLLYPGTTEKFLEVTMRSYRREIGEYFGKRVTAVFTDEPRLRPIGTGYHWNSYMPKEFEKRWGYDLVEYLPSLAYDVGDFKRIRHNYYQLLLELLVDHWCKPYYNYCDKNGLNFTGHYWEHAWPRTDRVPDTMAMYAWQHWPGIDTLFNNYRENTSAQFGNVRAVKEVSSVANQLGKERVFCEAYGGAGWQFRFEEMKRIGDWLYVLGVNWLSQHLSHSTLRGARKGDYPQSFSYHEPWWQAYHVLAEYFARLSAVMSQGEQVNRILLIEPTSSAWLYETGGKNQAMRDKIGVEFQKLVTDLAKAQVEFDIGCERIMADHGSVQGAFLKIGRRSYDTVVLSPRTENLNGPTMDLLTAYAKGGGVVIACGPLEARLVDGQPSERRKALLKAPGFKQIDPGDAPGELLRRSNQSFGISQQGGKGILLHHRRQLSDGEVLFITNTSIDSACSGVVESDARGIERWDLSTGQIGPYHFARRADGVRAEFRLEPCGSLLLFLSNKQVKPAGPDMSKVSEIKPTGPVQVRRTAPNVLKLDFVDITVGDELKKNIYCYNAADLIFNKHGLKSNPWYRGVQFKDELISMKFPPDSGFEATYHFGIEEQVPRSLHVIIERPDIYTITCNGKAVPAADGWWLDKDFGKIDISSLATIGRNSVTIKASPLTVWHELADAYIIGDFALKAVDSGFVIVPASKLSLGPWNKQGCPLYGHGVSYAQSFEVGRPSGKYRVTLPKWFGTVSKVTVNGKVAGYIHHQPWERDVTELIKPGLNRIEVVVFGSLKNPLGPHHGKPSPGRSGPGDFRKAPDTGPPPGDQYDTIGYGLFKPFELYRYQ